MICLKEMGINIMAIDATFWVAVSFIIFFGGLVYLKIPQKINEILNKLILDIKNEIDESEKLRIEAKALLDNAQKKLDTAQSISNEILEQTKKETLDKQIDEEIKKVEQEIDVLKKSAPEKISKIATETSSDLVKKLIGTEVNNSSISAIVDDLSKKNGDKYYGN